MRVTLSQKEVEKLIEVEALPDILQEPIERNHYRDCLIHERLHAEDPIGFISQYRGGIRRVVDLKIYQEQRQASVSGEWR